jgi:acyl-coenzyme A synthetase/AMP-(fatty) acid ligase
MAAGLPLAPLPAGSSSSEIAFLARLAQCEIVFTHPSQLKIIQGSGYPVERIILTEPSEQWHGKTLPDLLKIASQLPTFTTLLQHPIPKHEVALVVFSSGSTGKPKGISYHVTVVLSHSRMETDRSLSSFLFYSTYIAVMITHRNICALVIAKAITARSDLDEVSRKRPLDHVDRLRLTSLLRDTWTMDALAGETENRHAISPS